MRAFADRAVARGIAERNPFLAVPKGTTANKARDFQVLAEWTERILAACPSQMTRTLFALQRGAALRYREPISLTRQSIDFEANRLKVYATKTERYESGGLREVPISKTLARELKARLAELPPDENRLLYDANKTFSCERSFSRTIQRAGLGQMAEVVPKHALELRKRLDCERRPVARRRGVVERAVRTTRKKRIIYEFYPSITTELSINV